MSDGPAISVVIVNSARRDELRLVLKGLEYQRHANFEVIVVSDIPPGARPDSPLSPRWILFGERNISAARNLGLAAARGEIVAFCDDDAVPEFGWLAALSAPFADPRVGAAGGYVRGRNGVSFQWRATGFDRLGRDLPIPLEGTAPRVFAPEPDRFVKTVGTNSAFRREALLGIRGFDEAYRFFLDETDANLRLAEAGWSTAIVPLAEVHHGYAASPLRTANRVPTSLFELGASLVHFLRRHAPPGDRQARIDEFRREQAQRLMQHFELGRIDGATMRRLLAGLERGFAEGAARDVMPGPATGAEAAGFAPAPLRTTGRRRLFVAPLTGARATRAAARAAAARGDEVTLILPEPTPRSLSVRFSEDGLFAHRFGLLGKAERHLPHRPGTPRARVGDELGRIAAQRGALETDKES